MKRGSARKAGDRTVTIMSQTQAFENKLSRSSDACTLRGKLIYTPSVTTTPLAVAVIDPAGLGNRAAALSNVFSDYKVKELLIRFVQINATATMAVGILDDSSTAEGDAPININDIVELRTSAVSLSNTSDPVIFRYEPTNKALWYKTFNGATGSDVRLVAPGILYAAASATSASAIEIDYTLVFKGAIDIGST